MSIKRRLTVLIISTVVLASFFAALHGYRNSLVQLENVFDEELLTVSQLLSNFAATPALIPNDINGDIAYQIFSQQTLILQSINSPQNGFEHRNDGFEESTFDGQRWRTYSNTIDDTRIIVAHPIKKRIESAESVLFATITPIVFAIPIIAFLIIYIIHRSLSSLITLSNQIKQKNTDDLSEIIIESPPEEIAPVISRMNSLLCQLSRAFEREKQLAANAAHELRTPISVLTLTAHNIESEFAQQRLTPEMVKELKNNVARMAHVIEQMIALYRYSPDQFKGKKNRESLQDIVQEVISQNYEDIAVNQQTISLIGQDAFVLGDHFALSTLFENVLKNAIKYSGKGAEIRVTIVNKSDAIVFSIEDSGKGIKDQDYQQIFQHFYRSQDTVTREKGSGLGLSIVKHICELHQATIQASKSSLGGLKIKVAFPLATTGLDND